MEYLCTSSQGLFSQSFLYLINIDSNFSSLKWKVKRLHILIFFLQVIKEIRKYHMPKNHEDYINHYAHYSFLEKS